MGYGWERHRPLGAPPEGRGHSTASMPPLAVGSGRPRTTADGSDSGPSLGMGCHLAVDSTPGSLRERLNESSLPRPAQGPSTHPAAVCGVTDISTSFHWKDFRRLPGVGRELVLD